MTALFIHYMAPIMFLALIGFLLLGYPVAFSLAANGLLFAVIGIQLGLFRPDFLQALPERVFGVMGNETLLAIPFFTFMGLVLERSGMAEDLLDTIGKVFGSVRGGLAYAVVFVGALLAATTGVVAASVISMGLISLPIMLRYGYDRRVASGVIAASGTLAQIIPPSLVLIVTADQLGRSVGDMYEGAFIPGLVLALLYAGYILLVSIVAPEAAPGLPPEAQTIKEDGVNRLPRTIANFFGAVAAVPSLFGAIAAALIILIGEFANLILGAVGAPVIAWRTLLYAAAAGGGLAALAQLLRGVRDEFITRPHANLALLAWISGFVGLAAMWRTSYRGADFVVLTMFVGIVFAFLVAVGDRWRGLAGMLGALAAMAAAVFAFMALPEIGVGVLPRSLVWPTRILASVACGGGAWLIVALLFGAFAPMRNPVLAELTHQVTFVMVPPLFLIFLVLGTIFIGLATPTEGGAMGAAGALILATVKRRLTVALTRQAVEATAKLSAFVIFILIGARVFSLTFYGVDGHKWVEELLVSLPGGQVGFLIVVNVIVFFLAFFLDFFELAFIVIPLLGPAADRLGIDLIWFGVILGVNMQTSFMHPPFGFALFYLRSVAPKEAFIDRITGLRTAPVTTGQIYWGAVPFVIIQCIMVALVIAFPGMVMHYKDKGPKPDPGKQIEIPLPDLPPLGLPPLAPPPPR